jgi:hypothetical protein
MLNTGNVSGGSGATHAYYQNLRKNAGAEGNRPAVHGGANKPSGDVYTSGPSASGGVYSKGSASVQKLWGMAEARYASMRGAVESLIGGTSGYNGQAFWAMASDPKSYENFEVDEATRAKAQELISEDGYFGVKKTTDRIMEFAKALAGAGASEETIENLRSAAQAGFDYVADLFGGFDNLPEVTKQTYDAVMKAFDEWVGKPAADDAAAAADEAAAAAAGNTAVS